METHPQEDTPERHNDISMAQRTPGTVSAAHDTLKLRDMIPTNIEPVPLNHTSARDNYSAPVATDQHHVAPSADRRTSIVASQIVRDDAADDDLRQPIVEHIPGEFPDDHESTYEGYSSDEEPTITEFVSNAASAATSFFRNVSRRVSRNIESLDIPAADKQSSTTTATTASTGVLPSNIAGSIVGSAAAVANKAKESLGNLYQTTTAKLAVPGQSSDEAAAHGVYSLDDSTPTKLEDVTRQVFAESTLPVPSVQTSITEPTDELPCQDTVLAVPATAMDQPELVGDIIRETAVIGVSPVTGQPEMLADVVQETPVVAVAKAQPTQVVETPQYPVIVPGAAQSPVTAVVETARDTVTKVAAAAPEKIHATKETAIGAYESARDTVSHVSAVAPETIQVTKEAAANSYGSSYEQAAARTANLPVVAKETAQKAVATVQETTAKVQETIARTVDTAQHSVAAEKARELASSAAVSREAAGESYSTSYEQAAARTANLPVVAKETAQKAVATVQETARTTKETVGQTVDTIVNSAAADKAREIVYTAQIVAEDAAHATVAAVSTAAAKTAETSRAVYGVAADTSSRAVSTTSEVVSPAIAATRESTITSYHQSEERTTEILEHARDIAVEYGTTAKVLATDALHKVEDAAVYVYHHTSEGAVSTAHKAAHVGEVAYHSTADALTAAKHVAENVAHRAVDGAVVAKDASVRSATVASNRVAEVSAPVVQAASNAGRAVANTASSAATATANTVGGATRAVVNTASNAASATANTVGGATRAVANTASSAATATANTVGGATRAVVNTASNAASATANSVTGATRSIGNTASNAVTATKNTVTGFTTRSAAPADTDATREVASVDSAKADAVVPKEGWKIKETVTNTASNVLNNAVAVPKAAATGVAHAATAVGSAVGSAASTAARTVVAVPVAIGHGVVNTASAVGQGVSNAATGTVNTVKAIPSAVVNTASAVGQGVSNAATGTVNTVKAIPSAATNTASNAASSLASLPTTIKSVLPGGTTAAKETPATVVPETGATVPVEWRQGVADSTELKEEQEATPLEDIVYAEEMERTRREQPGATARQFADHAREEATAFTEGIRAHLGESSEIPALAVPRREWAREAEEVERQDRVEAQARQRSLASQQAHAFADGLSSVSGDGDHLKSVASHAQALKLEGDIEAERESRVSEPNEDGAHSVAAAVQAGISEQGNPAVHIAQRELTRSAEETARDERTSESSQMHDQQTAEKVASLFQAGLGGANTTSPAADVAKIALIRTAEDTERDERMEDGWKHQPHAHSEARLVQEAFEEGVELNPVHGGYKLAEVRNVEEQERERRIREEGDHLASTAAAGAVRDAIHNADADAPAALHVAERELVRSAEEEERLDRMASNDGLRTAGSPTQIAFALRAGLLRDGEHNPAIDVARSAAEHDDPSSSRSAKAAVGVTPSTLNAAPSDARNRVFKQDQTEHVQPATFQDWGAHNNSLLGHDSLSAGQEPLSVPTFAADVKEPEPDVADDATLGDIGDGNRSPPSTPMEGDLPPSSSTVPRIHTTSLADQRATLSPKTSHTHLSLSPTSDHRPPTPSRDDSTAVDQIGLETIRPNPLDDPNAQIVPTTPTTPLTERRQSTPSPTDSGSSASRRSSGSGGERTPHRLHALKEKAIGKLEHTIGKVVHSEHLKVEGSARQAAGAAELQAVKERRKSADYSSRTSSPTH